MSAVEVGGLESKLGGDLEVRETWVPTMSLPRQLVIAVHVGVKTLSLRAHVNKEVWRALRGWPPTPIMVVNDGEREHVIQRAE
jgi:hypothetical protein